MVPSYKIMVFISSVESCRIMAKGVCNMDLQENMAEYIRRLMALEGKDVKELSEENRRRFAELFLEMVRLWDQK